MHDDVERGEAVAPVGTALGLSAGLLAIAAACFAIAKMIQSDSLPRNGLIGIRTRATQRSDASWLAGHHAARPSLLTAAVVGVCGAVTTVLAGLGLRRSSAADGLTFTLGISFYVVLLGVVVHATIKATRAATRVER